MKRLISMLMALAMIATMLAPAALAEGTGYIAAPYAVDEAHAGPKEYLAPVFYENEGGPTIGVTLVGVIEQDGKYFKDSDNDQELDVFEDWRLDTATRTADLIGKMDYKQKIALTLVQLMCSPNVTTMEEALDENGNVRFDQLMVVSDKVLDVANDDETRVNNSTAEIIAFGSRMGVVRKITDIGAGALWNNAMNMTAEYGAVVKGEPNIPFITISNPQDKTGEPDTMGLAAAVMGDVAAGGDYSIIEKYADLDRQVWDAKGIDRMYGNQIDLITCPRWSRNLSTFSEVPEVTAGIATALVKGYQQGTDGVGKNSVALIMKHFPGDGAARNGLESHHYSGQWRVYDVEGSLEKYQLVAFQAAVDANVAGIMSCYSRPSALNAKQTYRGIEINPPELASAYNPVINETLLREAMGFDGFINTDSTILTSLPYGAEDKSLVERVAMMINAGTDIIGDFAYSPIDYELCYEAYTSGLIKEEALDRAAGKNLESMIAMGRFENPYEDVEKSVAAIAGIQGEIDALSKELNQKSVVLLKNHDNVLPLKETGKKVFIASFSKNGNDDNRDISWTTAFTNAGYTVVDDEDEADILLLDVLPVLMRTGTVVNSIDLVDGLETPEYDANTGEKTGEVVDVTTVMDVEKIARYANKVHENGGIVIGTITITSPWILTNLEPYCDALLGNFDSSTTVVNPGEMKTGIEVQMNVLTGAYNPTGKLPVTMVSCNEVIAVCEEEIDGVVYETCVSPNDVPGYDKDQYIDPEVLAQSPSGSYAYKDADGNFYKAWFGLSY